MRFVSELGAELRDLRRSIVSAVAGQRFLGYLDGQRERMLGLGRQSHVPNRPELVAALGVAWAAGAARAGWPRGIVTGRSDSRWGSVRVIHIV